MAAWGRPRHVPNWVQSNLNPPRVEVALPEIVQMIKRLRAGIRARRSQQSVTHPLKPAPRCYFNGIICKGMMCVYSLWRHIIISARVVCVGRRRHRGPRPRSEGPAAPASLLCLVGAATHDTTLYSLINQLWWSLDKLSTVLSHVGQKITFYFGSRRIYDETDLPTINILKQCESIFVTLLQNLSRE